MGSGGHGSYQASSAPYYNLAQVQQEARDSVSATLG